MIFIMRKEIVLKDNEGLNNDFKCELEEIKL